jgi:hypothetical protein
VNEAIPENDLISCCFTMSQSLPLQPSTSGEYIASAFAGERMKEPGVVTEFIVSRFSAM